MPNWWARLAGAREEKQVGQAQTLMSLTTMGEPSWSRRNFVSLASSGFTRNPVVYRATRLVAEAANRVPLVVEVDGARQSQHPLLELLSRPNGRQSGSEMLEAVYAYLQTAGNAYIEAVCLAGEVRQLHVLRPDRVEVVLDRDGRPVAYDYVVRERARRLRLDAQPVAQLLHMGLFHPLDDHYGMAPLDAAGQSLDIHNAAAGWNKALLDNAARPSGALVYSAAAGTLTDVQFSRLKGELESGFQGAANAGRPMVLEGGLDWKPMALTPAEMDFVGLKDSAARDIALAFGVPPQLLGIPGDNTYSNLAEANRALWRHTVVPLVRRVADDLSFWLAPGFGGVRLVPDFDGVEALAEDRAALWSRIGGADFLSEEEKRAMLGIGG